LSLLKRLSEAVKPRFPQVAIPCEPLIESAERLRPQTIKTPLAIRSHRDEACFVEDAQMTGDARLVNSRLLNDVVDLPLAVPQCLNNATAPRVSQGLEGVYLRFHAYTLLCI
jgi:hypothetical protein